MSNTEIFTKIWQNFTKKVLLQVIILWPFNHNAANRTSLGAFGSETLFFEWPYIYGAIFPLMKNEKFAIKDEN